MRNWPVVALDEIFEIARGGSPRPIDAYITDDPDGINWISISDASESLKYITRTKKRIRKEGAKRSRAVKPGDFLLSNSMSFGKPYIMGTHGCIHDGWLVLTPRRKDADSDFFYHLIGSQTVYREFERRAAGATVKNLNIDLVKQVKIPFPPIAEQRRIAAILDQAEALRTKRRQALAKLDALIHSIFLKMFGDPARNGHNLPQVRLGELGKWQSGGTPPRQEEHYFKGDIPWFSSGELNSMYVSTSHESISLAAIEKTSARPVPKGALLLGMYDTAALKAAIAGANCSCNQAIAFSYLDPSLVEPVYAYSAITIGRDHFRRLQRGIRQKNLNLSMVKDIRLPLPTISAQRKFTSAVIAIEEIRTTQDQATARLEQLVASLQHRAFRGEL